MVEDRTTDGKRIAQLLSSEVSSREDSGLDGLEVVNADADVEPSADGELAYEIAFREDGDETTDGDDGDAVLAEVYVHDERVRVEFRERVDAAADAAEEVGLRVRPKAVRPPRTLVFVEDGAEVKRATDVFVAVL
ncbi:hypothetical protein M0R88_02560 [Halorussus gelatinilyticus]|uniref:DUF7993 domain-containing protein n=1 Tax=Halorussus gelatinilyticus TaxID=2937524 RepID=A0A8U0IK28_9EURY|nr:hypothetical protein [Halorussus gelatinilyticus]UPW00991.1 hypothetical protein M0R88_02560 [Halorussus gelatinilyticus]